MNLPTTIGRPWRCDGTELSPNLLLMAKLLVLILIRGDVWEKLGDPFLPFLPAMDLLRSPEGWCALALRAGFAVGALAVMANAWPEIGCLILGSTVAGWQFAVTPEFRNHIFICGCLLILAGCHRNDSNPWLIRWQFFLLYAGAALNKLLQPDWWSGQMLLTWLTQELPAAGFRHLSALIPASSLALFLSWFTMIAEVVLAVCFWRKQSVRTAVWMVIALHGGMFVFLMGYRFGHFIEDILVGLIAFLEWPRQPLELRATGALRTLLARVLKISHPDAIVRLGDGPVAGNWLELHGLQTTKCNESALRTTLLLGSSLYLLLFTVDWLLEAFIGGKDAFRYLSVAAALALLCIVVPIRWPRSRCNCRATEGAATGVGL